MPPIAVAAGNASRVATGLITLGAVEAVLPDSTTGILGRAGVAGSLPGVSAGSPNSTALALALSVVANGPGTLDSPLGGDAVISGTARSVTARFNTLQTVVGSLNGEVAAAIQSGSAESGSYVAAVTFSNLGLQSRSGTWTYNGSGTLDVERNGTSFEVSWVSNLTVSRANSSVSFHNFKTANRMTLNGATGTCASSLDGSMTLTDMFGQSGEVNVITTSPLVFSGDLANNAATLTLTAGALSINDGQLTVTVVRNDAVSLVVGGATVKEVAWAYLGGPLRMVFALRPTIADRIFTEGNFLTVDGANPSAQAMAVLDGRILALGGPAEVAPFQGQATEVVSLHGKTCLPGFIEPHMHISLTALNRLSSVTPQVVPCGTEELGNTIEQVLANLTQAVQAVPNAQAIYGFSFDPSRLVPAELMQNLTLQQLDGVSTSIPIVVQNASQHISYANSAAWRATGFWPTAPNPPFTAPAQFAPFIPTDPNTGLPTGQINEFAQNPFIKVAISGVTGTDAAKKAYLLQWRLVMDDLAARGITTTTDMLTGAALGLQDEQLVFGAIEFDPTNPCRLRCYIDTASVDFSTLNVFAGEGYDRLRFIGAKVVTDGSTQGLTAGLNFNYIFPGPFPVAPNGLLDFASAAAILSVAQPWYDAGFQLAFHANGDAAQDQVFAVVGTMQQVLARDARTRVEHFTVHQSSELAAHIQTARQLRLEIGHTIGHVFFWGQVFNDTLLGPAVAPNIDPVASEMAAGLSVSTHSDSPVSSPNPLRNIQTVSTRLWQVPPQQVLGLQQIVPVPDAIKTVTINPAHAMFCDDIVGSLEVGKLADLVVLAQDPTAIAPGQISAIPVVATYLEGRRVSGTAP